MATLVVRQVDERIVEELKEQARRSGRSAEAQHRLILHEALLGKGIGGQAFVRSIRQDLPELTDNDADIISQGSRTMLDGTTGLIPKKDQ